jgi:hypothetical protein
MDDPELCRWILYRGPGARFELRVETPNGIWQSIAVNRWQAVEWNEMQAIMRGMMEDLEGWEPRLFPF